MCGIRLEALQTHESELGCSVGFYSIWTIVGIEWDWKFGLLDPHLECIRCIDVTQSNSERI